ncbi:MAG: glycosyltransferase family 4 protein [Anaerolineae bacterium]|nr:glycosyltransferase family 4 protein [Anaerolineae bacterium]
MSKPSESPYPVLHVITRLIVGGAQENTMYTAALLDPARYRVELVCGPQTGAEGSLVEEVRARGIPLTILPELVRPISPLRDLIALLKLTRFIRRRRFTIVHTHSSKAGIIGRLAAWLAGVPVIVHTVHGWSFHDYMPFASRYLYILLERCTAHFTDALILVARSDREKGLRAGIGRPEQYHLIRSAIPLEEFDPATVDRFAVRRELGLPLDAPVLGNVGRFSTQKNPLDWVRMAGKVARELPECRFLLVGDGPLREEVESALVAEGIADRTVLTGLRRDVPRMLAAMDVFALTSLWEGLPRVIPQAMSMRVPVVANRADGTAEAIIHGETGYLCNPGDLDGMAAYCLQLLRDPVRRQTMGASGRARAAGEFDVRSMVAQIAALYEALLAAKGLR